VKNKYFKKDGIKLITEHYHILLSKGEERQILKSKFWIIRKILLSGKTGSANVSFWSLPVHRNNIIEKQKGKKCYKM